MRCEEIMKKPVECCGPDDTVQTAARKMRDAEIGFVPICDSSNKVLGTLTDRDIVLRVCADNKPVASTKIKDVMTREAITCKTSDDLSRAEQLMGQHHKSRLMVTDNGGKLVGVISFSDIADHEGADRVAETARQITSREIHTH